MKIAILLPTMGEVCSELHDWLLTMHSSTQHDIVEMKTYCSTPIEKAFNSLSLQFLNSDCEYAFIVNSDERPPDNALDVLLSHDKDIVSGLCFKWDARHGPLPVAARWSDETGYFMYQYGEGLQQTDRCGFSGVLIKRKVFEAIPIGTYAHQSSAYCHAEDCDWCDHTDTFTGTECPQCGGVVAKDGGLFISPEFMWLDEARRLGFEVWVDFNVRLRHFKDHIDLLTINDLMATAGRNMKLALIDVVEKRLNAGDDAADILDDLVSQEA